MAAAAPVPLIHLSGSITIDNLVILAHFGDTGLNIVSYLLWQ
jgi:hypothetical protein